MEFSGTVESVGKDVTRFRAGDEVFGSTSFRFGAHAEYLCLRKDAALAARPGTMPLEEAAAVAFGGFSALHFLRKANVRAGERILVYGASGSVGVFAVQLAKHFFGAHVTGVCSTANVDLVKSLGADEVIDYTKEDFASGGRRFDVIVDTVGTSGFSRSLNALTPGGRLVRIGASGSMASMLGAMLRGMWVSRTGPKKVIGGTAKGTAADMAFFKELIEAGKLRTVIDRRYPMDQIAEAYRLAEGGHKRGHALVLVETTR
jgi:NADPH:quinone reductase-like Zn-dependent oxidoreductase